MPAVFVEFTMGDGKAKIMIRAASVTSYFDLSVLALDKGAEPNANTRVTFGLGAARAEQRRVRRRVKAIITPNGVGPRPVLLERH